MAALKIDQIAKGAGVSVETVRYYEREGLLERPARRPSGYREYPEEVGRNIQFIKRAQTLGSTLKGISGLLALKELIRACSGQGGTSECSILDALDQEVAQ